MSDLDDLRSAVRDLLTTHAPARSALRDDPSLWKRLSTEMGLTALPVEDVPWSWVTTVLEETGRVLLRSPYLPTVVAAAALQGAGQPLEGLADGSLSAALALDGRLDAVPHAATADVLLLSDGDDLVLCTDFRATPVDHLDVTRAFAQVSVGTTHVVGTASYARDLHWSALAAESVGAAQALLERVVQHLLDREQFGRPLGSFQALRHRVADLTVLVEAARSSAWYAATDLPAAPLAKAVAADAFVTVAGECLQLFGGIGFTWEHDAHLYFKRAWTTALTHGDSASLRALAFDRSGL
ncbi:MAG TPA: acyl-CoA dehydrogenase [Mycobacteriales bacterium]|nr:acyl-CoA dehydrogenase [Mycobacteriales bacterium]